MEEKTAPYECHVFVCTNDRQGNRKSCADGNSAKVRSTLKDEIKDRGWQGKVRVSKSGCMGLCQKGSNVIIYPQKIWFSGVLEDDTEKIVKKVQSLVEIQA
jgi:(2Fe-2S) ferredoxin